MDELQGDLERLRRRREELEEARQQDAAELATAMAHVAATGKHQDRPAWEKGVAQVNELKDRLSRLRTQKRLVAQEISALEQAGKRDHQPRKTTEQALLAAAKLLKRWKLAGVVFLGEEERVYSEVQEEAARLAWVARHGKKKGATP